MLSVHHTYPANLPRPFKRALIEHHSAFHSCLRQRRGGAMQQLISHTCSPPSDMTGIRRSLSAQTAHLPTRILSDFSLQLEFVHLRSLLCRFMDEWKDSMMNDGQTCHLNPSAERTGTPTLQLPFFPLGGVRSCTLHLWTHLPND